MRKRMLRMHPMAAWSAVLTLAAASAGPLMAATNGRATPQANAQGSQVVYTPGVTLTAEVMTPEGTARMYPVGAGQEAAWQPGMPVYIGDRIRLNTFVSTGDATLREAEVRLDNAPLRTLTEAPWVVELDTSNWSPGYHFVEVFARSTDPRAPLGSATMTFLAQPAPTTPAPTTITERTTGAVTESVTLPATAVAGVRETPQGAMTPPSQPGRPVQTTAQGVPMHHAGLNAMIRAQDQQIERQVRANQVVSITGPTLFGVTAGPQARRYVYALTRDGQEIFRSEPLPLNTLIRLQPRNATTGLGLGEGELVLWVWAGDEANLYGAPMAVRVNVAPGS